MEEEDHRVHLVLKVQLVTQEKEDLRVQLEELVLRELEARMDNVAPLVPLVTQVTVESRVRKETRV